MAKSFRLACPLTSYPSKQRPELPLWLKSAPQYARRNSHAYWLKIYWATPPWLNQQHIEEMRRIYLRCPKGKHVDHIVPLKSNIVCGLHVPWNLEIVDEKQNLLKSNHIWPDHPLENRDMFNNFEPHQMSLLWQTQHCLVGLIVNCCTT